MEKLSKADFSLYRTSQYAPKVTLEIFKPRVSTRGMGIIAGTLREKRGSVQSFNVSGNIITLHLSYSVDVAAWMEKTQTFLEAVWERARSYRK